MTAYNDVRRHAMSLNNRNALTNYQSETKSEVPTVALANKTHSLVGHFVTMNIIICYPNMNMHYQDICYPDIYHLNFHIRAFTTHTLPFQKFAN